MRNITNIEKYGRNSFSKAQRVKPRAYRRKSTIYLSFTIKSPSGDHYHTRIAIEGRRMLAECVNATKNEPCKGFLNMGHCYHVGRALQLA